MAVGKEMKTGWKRAVRGWDLEGRMHLIADVIGSNNKGTVLKSGGHTLTVFKSIVGAESDK